MKTLLLSLAAVTLLSSALVTGGEEEKKREAPAKAIAIGTKAPKTDVKMEGIDGKKVSIEDLAGEKGTLVMFSCNHCPWVVKWEDRIAELGNAYPDKGIGWVVINSNDIEKYPADSMDKMKERAKERGFEFAYVIDETSDVARAFGATKTPEAFLFDAEMKLVYHGAIDDNAESADEVENAYLKDAMDALIAGEKIETPETKFNGCGIKMRAPKAAGQN
jgi:peroxiredoxin